MTGKPVTVRLLDPPLHEFLPRPESCPRVGGACSEEALQEANPMLGTRGRSGLGVLIPELYGDAGSRRAVSEPPLRVADSVVEIMVPLVAYVGELTLIRALIELRCNGRRIRRLHGRHDDRSAACVLRSGAIARHADSSFGTNDLTQTGIGLSRDDIEGRVLPAYMTPGSSTARHSRRSTAPGIGEMLRIGAGGADRTKPGLKLGVCGEHGGRS